LVDTTRTQVRAPQRSEITGVLLCGGRSERMGRDKALEPLGDRALLEYPLAALRAVAERVVLACGPLPRYAELGCELALDRAAGAGPLAGLLAGLEASRTEWTAVLACDMPRADAATLKALLDEALARNFDACLLEIERGTQPMFAVYRKTCTPAVRAALDAGERRMISFHGREVGGRSLRVGALRVARPDELALNLNTPEELRSERMSRSQRLPAEVTR
jgi:molybdopterin-guanine dinucleotide biosynthesis protein A